MCYFNSDDENEGPSAPDFTRTCPSRDPLPESRGGAHKSARYTYVMPTDTFKRGMAQTARSGKGTKAKVVMVARLTW